jgi:hypothetical protein
MGKCFGCYVFYSVVNFLFREDYGGEGDLPGVPQESGEDWGGEGGADWGGEGNGAELGDFGDYGGGEDYGGGFDDGGGFDGGDFGGDF